MRHVLPQHHKYLVYSSHCFITSTFFYAYQICNIMATFLSTEMQSLLFLLDIFLLFSNFLLIFFNQQKLLFKNVCFVQPTVQDPKLFKPKKGNDSKSTHFKMFKMFKWLISCETANQIIIWWASAFCFQSVNARLNCLLPPVSPASELAIVYFFQDNYRWWPDIQLVCWDRSLGHWADKKFTFKVQTGNLVNSCTDTGPALLQLGNRRWWRFFLAPFLFYSHPTDNADSQHICVINISLFK